jgi:hypothetical protein
VQAFGALYNRMRYSSLSSILNRSVSKFICGWKHVTILVTDLVPMVGRQLGWRLPRLLIDQFTRLCRSAGLRPSEAVEEFMSFP